MDDLSPMSTIHQKYAPDTAHCERYFIAGFGVYYTPILVPFFCLPELFWLQDIIPGQYYLWDELVFESLSKCITPASQAWRLLVTKQSQFVGFYR
jgi:hypothetical protein